MHDLKDVKREPGESKLKQKEHIRNFTNILNLNRLNIKAWLNAFRLRTLPLALSSVLMGITAAHIFGFSNMKVSVWALITTTLLQILSNLANDYGDAVKGTDNDKRIGPLRTVQSGLISKSQMKLAIIIFSILSFASGLYLLLLSKMSTTEISVFILFGILAIIAAIKYTVGKKAYGYSGFGDLFVFLFFGLLAVMGTYYLIAGNINWILILPAISVGFLSTAVLNLNNLRDFENDKVMGKRTLVVRIGIKYAKLYQTLLINLAFIALLFFVSVTNQNWVIYLSFLVYPLFLIDLVKIDKEDNLREIDPFLKKTALKTFLLVLVFTLLVFIF